jgi:uncharacterized low-complexity protein
MKRITGVAALTAALSIAAFSSVAVAQQGQSANEAQAQSPMTADALPQRTIDVIS